MYFYLLIKKIINLYLFFPLAPQELAGAEPARSQREARVGEGLLASTPTSPAWAARHTSVSLGRTCDFLGAEEQRSRVLDLQQIWWPLEEGTCHRHPVCSSTGVCPRCSASGQSLMSSLHDVAVCAFALVTQAACNGPRTALDHTCSSPNHRGWRRFRVLRQILNSPRSRHGMWAPHRSPHPLPL